MAGKSSDESGSLEYQAIMEWARDCIRWHGRVLNGSQAHWCSEWDFLPIDQTCAEISCCLCFSYRPIPTPYPGDDSEF